MDSQGMSPVGAQGVAVADVKAAADVKRQNHQYPTRNASGPQDQNVFAKPFSPSLPRGAKENHGVAASGTYRVPSTKKDQKHVVFQLTDPQDPRIQARLPMRVMIQPHDTTDSIITTVKNFYGLYDHGVLFENKNGTSIIAAYENFEKDMTVYVRTVAYPTVSGDSAMDKASPVKAPSLGAPFEVRPQHSDPAHSPTRQAAQSVGARSMSPRSDGGQRSASAAPGGQRRAHRSTTMDHAGLDHPNGYSSGDNDGVSVTSSGRFKTEHVNAEISVTNIVEGGRRKRAFESSELPLFVPPQVPITTSISSISPQRRNGASAMISPYAPANQQTFSYTQPLPSPMSYGAGPTHAQHGANNNQYSYQYQQSARQLRGRPSATTHSPAQQSVGGILPTPDPTTGSAISDEDVALQLIRLGDPSAFTNGRNSNSTVDDAMSGKAEAASSDEEDEEENEEAPQSVPSGNVSNASAGRVRKKQRLMNDGAGHGTSDEEYDNHHENAVGDHTVGGAENGANFVRSSLTKVKGKSAASKTPRSPASMPAPSRKASVASVTQFQSLLGPDEEDLSSKPRCQRCRKSKKGCDRQRPCGRCKDAGIGAEGCVSEDEHNGRKGRFGRHMGVPVKKSRDGAVDAGSVSPQAGKPTGGRFLAPALPDKMTKRKR